MKIKFCGASSGVTGSCHLLTTANHKVLLDCGQFQGGKAQEALNYEPFPFDPKEIECVILSHAHIDHCGRIPLLVKRGFTGKIYCTDATADLLDVMLKDSGFIHEKDAEWKSKRAARAGKPPVEPLYTYDDALKALEYVEPILYDQQIKINDHMKIVFNDAGHILGSAITEIWVCEDSKESKIVFSGDLGMVNRPILKDPTIIKKADYVIMETTYGNRNHPANITSIKELLDIVLNTTRRGGTVVIPSFAVGRTQELVYEFNKFYEEDSEYKDELDQLMVYVDSPMATTATEVFRKNAQVFDDETRDYILRGDNPLDFKNLKFTRSTAESQALNLDRNPKIIISASGMCEAGRIRHHLKHNLWDARSSVIFVGYQAEGTLGKLLVEGVKDIVLFGEEVHVNAEIYNLEGFSGHADQNGLFSWLAGFRQKPKQIFLVHGEEDSKKDFGKLIHDKLGYEPVVVLGNSEFELDMNTAQILNYEQAEQEAVEDEEIQAVRRKISDIHSGIESILYNTDLAMGRNISQEKLVKINNIVQELAKATMVLGSAVTEEDRSREEPVVDPK
ncbi:MBL fold metallo-hydrolase RNA specificity domain-containing protein [Emergencia sp. 1XD21-10]|uniref:MBL fold metallo-hydrolase RNA specificity domain-containing protein n=1 Tax=Emergencia sp. 1XD21-10 TaxID=2304569 RepID=UPI00137B337D|nr:MBL fold metallo-hydrolase [Emergencia sp. 1XD21-10]NCF00210.1 MBL fold metallo-hydrolase [Emergencia sp. 1XD21-10]